MAGLCKCTNPVVSYTKPPCVQDNCIRAAHIYVKQEDSIYPCGETLLIDISNKIFFDSKQDNSIATFEVISHSSNLRDLSFITNPDNSIIQFQVTSNYGGYPSKDYLWGTVVYKVRQGMLSDIATITIPFKSHCTSIDIPNDKYCDPCTGDLIDKPVNISVSQTDTSSSVNISVTN